MEVRSGTKQSPHDPPVSRVLVVDDDDAIRMLVTHLFVRRGLTVVSAGDGAEALECLRDGQFDLLVLDLMLPRVDGIGVLNYLATAEVRPPVILMTAASPSVLQAVPKQHIRTIISKPFELKYLLVEAESALAARPSNDETKN